MDKYNWREDPYLRTALADTASAPVAVKDKKFEEQVTFVVKPVHGLVYRKTCPAWAVDTVKGLLDADENVSRYFIEEKDRGNSRWK